MAARVKILCDLYLDLIGRRINVNIACVMAAYLQHQPPIEYVKLGGDQLEIIGVVVVNDLEIYFPKREYRIGARHGKILAVA